MRNVNKNGYGTIEEFVEHDRSKQIEMEEMLRDCKLEEIMSPIYFIQNVNAWIMGWLTISMVPGCLHSSGFPAPCEDRRP